jgi:hypothetical protein
MIITSKYPSAYGSAADGAVEGRGEGEKRQRELQAVFSPENREEKCLTTECTTECLSANSHLPSPIEFWSFQENEYGRQLRASR